MNKPIGKARAPGIVVMRGRRSSGVFVFPDDARFLSVLSLKCPTYARPMNVPIPPAKKTRPVAEVEYPYSSRKTKEYVAKRR